MTRWALTILLFRFVQVFSLKKQDADSFCGTAAASLGRSVSVASCGYSDEYTDCEASGQEGA